MASSFSKIRSFFPTAHSARIAGFAVAGVLAASLAAHAQVAPASSDAPAATQPAQTAPPVTFSNTPAAKTRKQDKVIESKDTKAENKKVSKDNPLEGVDARLPDKVLYDKALDAIKHGRYDVARLDLQTLLNTYGESQYQMRSKLAIADSWFKEGGTAALTQAEQEYKDFITFFPNAPEAAEAQMRVGDIYFKQMDKPDRDYAKAVSAEHEYRLFLQQFPESVLVPQVTQRLRDVQEVMATREASIGDFYASHSNFAATIARYQTVVDTYPLYSHLDQVLIGLGDAYEAQAHFVRNLPNLPEGSKARLEKLFDDQAAANYRKVVLEHSAAPHAEDAKDRLAAMGQKVPTPTAEQLAASAALEASRSQYHLTDVVRLLFLHEPDTVQAATVNAPSLEDPKPTLAPSVIHQSERDFAAAVNPAPLSSGPAPTPKSAEATAVAPTPAPAPAAPTPLAFEDVPTAGAGSSGAVNTNVTVGPATSSRVGSNMSVEIVNPGSSAAATPVADPSGGLAPPVDKSAAPLPAVEKPAVAPDVLNDVPATGQPAAAAATNGKKPPCDKSDESCSSKKKKKGLAKLNPF
jgi:outer membrane protein assembly factor BamD